MTSKFTEVSANEIKLEIFGPPRNYKFLIIEQNAGVYSIGRAVHLYCLDDSIHLKKTHIKELAWTKSDNHGGMGNSDAHFKSEITTLAGCRSVAIDYLEKLLGIEIE